MARKTKESEKITKQEEQITSITNSATSSRKKVVSSLTKNNSVKSKTTTTKKVTAQTKKKSSSKKESAKLEKEVIATTSEKTTTSKSKKATPSKKTTKTKTNTSTSMKKSKTASPEKFAAEYYDFPDKYNITMVKILAQTPKTLFIYWEISEDDIKSYIEKYGENFFEITKPILTVYNDTLNYSFEVEVNDFANSWYLNINDSKCNYHVEFGRKPIPYFQNNITNPSRPTNPIINENSSNQNENTNIQKEIIPNYIYLTSSNEMSVPNNKILFNFKNPIKFKNVKTGFETQKDFTFISNLGILNINSLYKKLFPTDYYNLINQSNVTLHNISSGIFSSQFK